MNGGTCGSICKNKVCAGQTRADSGGPSRPPGKSATKTRLRSVSLAPIPFSRASKAVHLIVARATLRPGVSVHDDLLTIDGRVHRSGGPFLINPREAEEQRRHGPLKRGCFSKLLPVPEAGQGVARPPFRAFIYIFGYV